MPMRFAPATEAKTEGNSLFKSINRILKREVIDATKNITNLKIGDKINSKDGTFSLEIATFGPQHDFPIIFEPKAGEDLLDDKKIKKIGGDFHDESAVYVLKDEKTNSDAVQHPDQMTNSIMTTDAPVVLCKLCYLPAKVTADG